jgi:hypothetical protein
MFLFLVVLFLPIMLSCSNSSSGGAGDRSASVTVMIDVQTLSQAQSKMQQKFLGTVDDITSITVDVLDGSTPIISGQRLTYSNGVWSGILQNLPVGPSLTFIGHAYNDSNDEIFKGTTLKTMTGADNSVTILMAPIDDGVAPLFPRITRITVPAQIATSSTVTIGISVEASSGTLNYATTAAPDGGSFHPSSGEITLAPPGTTGTIVLDYTAPSTEGTYIHSIRLTNSQGNWVETDFRTAVVIASANASLTVQFRPVITAIGAKRSGSNVTFTAEVSDTTPTTLTYLWEFDGGLTFADNTINPATLQGYDETKSGNLTLFVTNGVGGTAVRYQIPPGLLPDNVTQYQLIISEYVEGTSNNKALEIWNPTSEALDLQACSINIYANGSPIAGSRIALASILNAEQTFVICHQSANVDLKPYCNAFSSSLTFNGNDAVELACTNVTVDVFGQIGFDPGLGWTNTYDHTLRRKCTVTKGDTNGLDVFDPTVEWDTYDVDIFDGLGVRGCS